MFDFRQAHGGFQHSGFSFLFFLLSDATTTIGFEALKRQSYNNPKSCLIIKKTPWMKYMPQSNSI